MHHAYFFAAVEESAHTRTSRSDEYSAGSRDHSRPCFSCRAVRQCLTDRARRQAFWGYLLHSFSWQILSLWFPRGAFSTRFVRQ